MIEVFVEPLCRVIVSVSSHTDPGREGGGPFISVSVFNFYVILGDDLRSGISTSRHANHSGTRCAGLRVKFFLSIGFNEADHKWLCGGGPSVSGRLAHRQPHGMKLERPPFRRRMSYTSSMGTDLGNQIWKSR